MKRGLLEKGDEVDDFVIVLHYGYIFGNSVEAKAGVLDFVDFGEVGGFLFGQVFGEGGDDVCLWFAGEVEDD